MQVKNALVNGVLRVVGKLKTDNVDTKSLTLNGHSLDEINKVSSTEPTDLANGAIWFKTGVL